MIRQQVQNGFNENTMNLIEKQVSIADKVVDTIASILPILSVLESTPRLVMSDLNESNVTDFRQVFEETLKVLNSTTMVTFLDYTPDDISSFELSARNFIMLELEEIIRSGDLKNVTKEDLNDAWKAHFLNELHYVQIQSYDGLSLNVYYSGDSTKEMVVIIPPCGMPKELYFNWIQSLSAEYFVVTWDARGLFSEEECKMNFGNSLDAQLNDLFAVIEQFGGSRKVHLLGLCGGVVIALKAASGEFRDRIASLSLWHGDLDFGASSLKTTHQKNTFSLMKMGSASISDAEMLYKQVMQKPSVLKSVPTSVAHLTIYPYATVNLFHNYCRLNRVLMETNSEAFLDEIQVPVLVVSSSEDDTAHPDGSRYLGKRLENVTFIEEPEGKHIEVFGAPQKLLTHQLEFLNKILK